MNLRKPFPRLKSVRSRSPSLLTHPFSPDADIMLNSNSSWTFVFQLSLQNLFIEEMQTDNLCLHQYPQMDKD